MHGSIGSSVTIVVLISDLTRTRVAVVMKVRGIDLGGKTGQQRTERPTISS